MQALSESRQSLSLVNTEMCPMRKAALRNRMTLDVINSLPNRLLGVHTWWTHQGTIFTKAHENMSEGPTWSEPQPRGLNKSMVQITGLLLFWESFITFMCVFSCMCLYCCGICLPYSQTTTTPTSFMLVKPLAQVLRAPCREAGHVRLSELVSQGAVLVKVTERTLPPAHLRGGPGQSEDPHPHPYP